MANTVLSDLSFVPEQFADYVQGQIFKKSNFLNSGAVLTTDLVFPKYGTSVTLPAFDALTGADEEKGSTAPSTNSLTGSAQVAAILNRVKKYGSVDMVRYASGSDPFATIGNEFAGYWANRMDEVAIASLVGAGGIAGVTTDISGASGAAAVIGASAIIDTQATMGEFAEDLQLIVMHPLTLAALRKANLVTNVPSSDGSAIFSFYAGMRVIVSTTAGLDVGGGVYNTILIGTNAVAFADGTPAEHVLETDREIGFADTVASSRRYVMHPIGTKWGNPVAGNTNAQLLLPANWSLGGPSIDGVKFRVLKHKVA